MEPNPLNEDWLQITDPEAARVLVDPEERRFLVPFIRGELSLSQAAQAPGLKLNTMHFPDGQGPAARARRVVAALRGERNLWRAELSVALRFDTRRPAFAPQPWLKTTPSSAMASRTGR